MSTGKSILPKLSLQVVSSTRGLQRIEKLLASVKDIWHLGEGTYNRIRTAVSEAVKNAIKHGNKDDADKIVKVEMSCTNDRCEVIVEDEGKGFEKRSAEGEGIKLMKKLASKLRFDKNGSSVKLEFDR